MKRLLLALSMLVSPAWADSTIDALGAGAAVSGTDLFPAYQGSNPAVKVTAAQLATFIGAGVSCPTGFTATNGACLWTQTASSSASLDYTGLTGTNYNLICTNLVPATDNVSLFVQFGQGGSPTWKTASYDYNLNVIAIGATGSPTLFGATSQAGIAWMVGASNSTARGNWLDAKIYGVTQAVNHLMTFAGSSINVTPTTEMLQGLGIYTADTTALTALRVIASSGDLTQGSCTLQAIN